MRDFEVRIPQFEGFDTRGKRVLDIGCGWGRIIVPLADQAEAIGLDVSTVMTRLTKKNARQRQLDLAVVTADAAHLPFRGRTADVVISLFVLQHLARPKMHQIIDEIAHVLRPNGVLFAYLPNRFGLDGISSKIIHDYFKTASHWGPAKVQYYHMAELRQIFANYFRSVKIYAREFRVPWLVFHDRVLVPFFMVPFLRRLSDELELIANGHDKNRLKLFATGLSIKAQRPMDL